MNSIRDIARNDARFGSSWLISLFQGEGFRLSLVFLNYIMLSLGHARINKKLFSGFKYHILGAGTSIRSLQVFLFTTSSHGANLFSSFNPKLLHKSSVAFFMATPFPSVLGLSRLPKKSRNFSITIGSGKTTSAQNVAGVWGVCWHGARLFHSKQKSIWDTL